MWFKMKFSLPQITNKIQFFNDIRNLLLDLRILFDKGEARIKHLQNLTKNLSEIKQKISVQLFDLANIENAVGSVMSCDDEFMRQLNQKYQGAGGSHIGNPIQGF